MLRTRFSMRSAMGGLLLCLAATAVGADDAAGKQSTDGDPFDRGLRWIEDRSREEAEPTAQSIPVLDVARSQSRLDQDEMVVGLGQDAVAHHLARLIHQSRCRWTHRGAVQMMGDHRVIKALIEQPDEGP